MEKSDDIDQFRITVSVSSQEKNSCFASLSFFLSALPGFPWRVLPSCHVLCRQLKVLLSPAVLGVCHQGISLCVRETWWSGLPTAVSRRSPTPPLYLPCAIHVFTQWLVDRSADFLLCKPSLKGKVVPCAQPRHLCHTSTIDMTHCWKRYYAMFTPRTLFLTNTMG